MNRQLWSCTNDICRAETWLAWKSAPQRDLWLVAADEDARPFSIAAAAPVCPYCGTPLAIALMLERAAQPAAAYALASS